jgi:predicted AlkP superfamily phosphohydrolase/phosphomutase/tetratricopeptide (TPR) repeat protein
MVPTRVLLTGWDAADWKVIRPLIEAGKMPHVRALVEGGASGQIATLHPPLSPMLWTSIATGKRPFKHGIHGFSEPTPDGRGVQPVTNLSRKSKALWNILHQSALRSVVIGWWPSHPAEPIDGAMVSDHFHRAHRPLEAGWPMLANAVHPAELRETIARMRVHPEQLTPELVEPFVPLAREIDQDQDTRLAHLLRTLAECMSVHAAAMWLMENREWDFFAVYHDAIDHFSHGFMKYHPPRQSWVDERDFELYEHVIAEAYQMHDRMLGELLAKAGGDTTVLLMSDHGFHPDHLRPALIPDIPAGPAVEHREYGIFAARGPGIKQGAAVHGTSVLDIAPTILTLFGLAVGEDMDGKVLAHAFEKPPQVKFVASWEEMAGADGRHPAHMRLDPAAARAALEQMVALGYIEKLDEDQALDVAKTVRELRYNLSEAYQDAGRHAEARAILAELHAEAPEEQRFAVRLFVSSQALGLLEEMQKIAEELQPSPLADYFQAQVWIAEKRYEKALEALERLGRPVETGELHLRLRRWRHARRVFEEALAIDPDDARAYLGLCRAALGQRRFAEGAQAALEALERKHHDPQGHFLLGLALERMREHERAAEAFRAALSINPNYPEAHARLAALLEKHLGDAERAREHRRLVRRMRRGDVVPRVAEEFAERLESGAGFSKSENALPADSLIVVTGLPRSGTSMLMQMLAAGGVPVLTDELRQADENNPRGYFEYEPVKNLLADSNWLRETRGKAVKIVAPLMGALPGGVACRVILCERDLDEVLDSQDRMLERKGEATRGDRNLLRGEYSRILARVKAMLGRRPCTGVLVIEHGSALKEPMKAAENLNRFLGGRLDVEKMAAAVGL